MFPSCLIILKAIGNRIKSWRECSFWFFLFCWGGDIEDIIWLCRDARVFAASFEKFFTSSLHSYSWIIFFNTRREISYLQGALLCSIYYTNTNFTKPFHFYIFLLCVTRVFPSEASFMEKTQFHTWVTEISPNSGNV